MTVKRRPLEEAGSLARGIYERDIRHLVEADHRGEIVAVDADTGHWGMGIDEDAAIDQLRETQPDALNILCLRVGYDVLHSFGGGYSLEMTE